MGSNIYVGSYIAHCLPIPATNGTYAFIDSEKFTDSYAPSVAEWQGVSNEVKDILMLYRGYKNASYRYSLGGGTFVPQQTYYYIINRDKSYTDQCL